MQLVKAMDAGGVYGTVRRTLTGHELKQELADQMLNLGGDLLLELLPEITDGSLQPTPQDDSAATYDSLITKADGVLDFHKPAVQLEREVRAYAGWPGSRTLLGERDIVVTAAHVLPEATDGQPGSLWREGKRFGFYTGDGLGKASGGVLVIDSLKPAGKADMSAEAFLAGLRGQL
jgi:methionyl-tRNA formyltransferase